MPKVRRFEDADLDEVLGVLRAALGEPPGLERTPELFRWKHLDNPFGRSLMFVAEIDGRVAGFRALMRWDLESPHGTVRCGRAVDTATHPDFQRRGVFRALTEHAIAEAGGAGIDLIFNTPNAKSGGGYLKMGWSSVGPVGVMARPGLGLIRMGDKAWPPANNDLTEESDRVAASLERSANRLATDRTPTYVEWRFGSHPTASYVHATVDDGVAIGRRNVRNGRRELVISELGGPSASAAVRSLIRSQRPDYSVGWFSNGTPERAAAIRAGLMPIPRMTALTLVARPLRDLDTDVATPESWGLALGDLELL